VNAWAYTLAYTFSTPARLVMAWSGQSLGKKSLGLATRDVFGETTVKRAANNLDSSFLKLSKRRLGAFLVLRDCLHAHHR
jgi:hypothetical protein